MQIAEETRGQLIAALDQVSELEARTTGLIVSLLTEVDAKNALERRVATLHRALERIASTRDLSAEDMILIARRALERTAHREHG